MGAKEIVYKFFELDKKDRKMYMLQVATIRTAFIALFKLIFGIIYSSVWFLINSIFYGILAYSKFRSVRDYRKIKKIKDRRARRRIAYNNYLYNGWLLALLGMAYLIINFIIFKTGKTHNNLDGYLIIIVALISYFSLTTAIIETIKYKRKKDPIVSAACQGNIAKALTSIVLTQVAILDEFSSNINRIKIDCVTGMIVGFVIILLGLRMVIKITKEDKKYLIEPRKSNQKFDKV